MSDVRDLPPGAGRAVAGWDEGAFGPVLRGGRVRRGGPDWRRLALLALSGLGIVVAVAALTATGVVLYGNSQVTRIEVPDLVVPGDTDGDGAVDIEELTEVLNVLVVGSDSREGLSDEELEALGTERGDGLRTDTIMLVHVDPSRDRAAVLSFPRDLLVTRCDGTRGRINAAYAIGEREGSGGATCLVQTVSEFTGIGLNHFVQVDFRGFIDIVDALGGVTVYLDEPLVDRHAGVDLPAGCVELDGRTALGFVRARRVDNDFGRIARQQRFIHEVVSQASSLGTLVNVPKLFALVDAAARASETDRDLTLNRMRRIAFSLRSLDPGAVDTRTVPATPRTINGASMVVADAEEAESLFAAFREGTVFPEGVGTDGPQPVGPADVPPVVVLNGAGVAGLANRAEQQLEAAGFTVAETGNADDFDHERTQVVYPDGRQEEAALLAERLDGAVLVPGDDDDDDDLTIILGADFTPRLSDDVSPEATLTPAPTPAPSPSPNFVGAEPSAKECS